MVEVYLSDEEQAEALKEWWKENRLWILSGIVLGLALLGAWKYWQQSQQRHAEDASSLYTELERAADSNDAGKVEQLTRDLQQKFSASPYAQQANLALAKVRVDAGKLDEAAANLRDVVDHAKDAGLVSIARLRLARVLIEQKKLDDALALLDPAKEVAFAGEIHELRGDALLAKGDTNGARGEYQQAVAAQAAEGGSGRNELLELKLQDLGEVPAPTVPAPAAAVENKKAP